MPFPYGRGKNPIGKVTGKVLNPSKRSNVRVRLDDVPSGRVIKQLEKRLHDEPPHDCELETIFNKSRKFVSKFPCSNVQMENLVQKKVSEKKLTAFANSVYPIVHHTSLNLMGNFLEHKKKHGSSVEKALYENMDVISFVDRLLKKRPMSFLGANDRYLLPPPTFKKGSQGFESIGSTSESKPLVLNNFLSYDEMRISALLSLSSWSYFINNGRRKNYGKIDSPGEYQNEGVIVGQVGARMKKEGYMEFVDCVITPKQNTPANGFGETVKPHVNSIWGKFWGNQLPSHDDANRYLKAQLSGQRKSPYEFVALTKDNLFNITVYKKRIAITAEILLCEASSRASAEGKKAYIHVVGLGLGVWRAFPEQDELFVEAWGDAMRNISDLSHIAYIDFSYIGSQSIHGVRHGSKFHNSGVTIKFTKRNLHDKVPDDCILVCNYAWDGNSLPGNEFWMGKLCSTGDSAAACSSNIAEIHNHYINPLVSSKRMKVATKSGMLMEWPDYINMVKKETDNKKDKSSDDSFSECSQQSSSKSTFECIKIDVHGSKRPLETTGASCSSSQKKIKLDRSLDTNE